MARPEWISIIARFLRTFLTEPAHAWDQSKKLTRPRPRASIPRSRDAADTWEEDLHRWLGSSYPCNARGEFHDLWKELAAELSDSGLELGVALDADVALARCIWCIVRHRVPVSVVETGVARGITSRVILEAMASNDAGHLWSIDLPPLRDPWWSTAATAVPDRLRNRWTYLRGDARRLLPQALRSAAPVDVFVHDSLHDDRHMTFEIEQALGVMPLGGIIVVDDVWESESFELLAPPERVTAPHESKDGAFGVAVKR